MADSYEQRLSLAQRERESAVLRRDRCYPGSVDWEAANEQVERWDATIRDLRDQAAGR